MTKQQELTERLSAEFNPYFIAIENESHLHSSGRGSDSHFKVVLVSDKFANLRQVARHRLIYQLLADDLANGVHALALHTYTLAEWLAEGEIIPKSSRCLGHGQ